MVTGSFALRPRLVLIRQPCLVRVVSVDSEIAVRTVEQIADGVGFGVLWSQGLWLVGWLLGWSCRQSRSRHPTGPISACANLRFMIGDPMANFQFHHLALAAGSLKTECRVKRIGCLLVIIKHKMPTHGGDRNGESDAQAPASNVDFVDGLVADFAVTGVPDPMPVVVKTIAGERLHRSWAGPEVVVNAGRNRLFRGASYGRAPLVTKRAGQVDIADGPLLHMLDCLHHARI